LARNKRFTTEIAENTEEELDRITGLTRCTEGKRPVYGLRLRRVNSRQQAKPAQPFGSAQGRLFGFTIAPETPHGSPSEAPQKPLESPVKG